MTKKSDTIFERVAKTGLGRMTGKVFDHIGEVVVGAFSGDSSSKPNKSSNELETDFRVVTSGLTNRICQEEIAELVMVKETGQMKLVFSKEGTITGEQLEYILTGKDYRKASK